MRNAATLGHFGLFKEWDHTRNGSYRYLKIFIDYPSCVCVLALFMEKALRPQVELRFKIVFVNLKRMRPWGPKFIQYN